MGSKRGTYDAVVVGGGHNGLVAATYLGQSGMSVLVLERLPEAGGAAASDELFPGLPARLSRHAQLVSLFPDRIIDELGLDMQLRPRRFSSYTPVVRDGRHTGLIVERNEGSLTQQSFRELTGSDEEYDAWRSFYSEVADFAKEVAPTLLEPLPSEQDIRDRVKQETWEMLVERPIGVGIEERFAHDVVRGVVASDALTGTFADLRDESLSANRTLVYHLVGNGTGEWRVPVGGMGAVTGALERAAWRNRVEIVQRAFVTKVETDGRRASVTWQTDDQTHTVDCDWVLGNVAPWVLRILLGQQPGPRPEGAQLKVNLLLERLPRLRSGASPAQAFAGTVHVGEAYSELAAAYDEAAAGVLPSVVPGELYCHTLTDPSVLGPLAVKGWHAFTFLGRHTPARLFSGDVDRVRDEAVVSVLDALGAVLEEPVESLLAFDGNGLPCLEAQAPQDIEADLAMPGGHFFHGDLSWPWVPDGPLGQTPAERWGVQTACANVVVCGAGAQRGGAVSGIAGHNAAMAVLDTRAGRL